MGDFTDTITELYNLTFDCYIDPNGEWGTTPKTGNWGEENATFGGVFGGVVNKDYELAISGWLPTYERSYHTDFHFRYFSWIIFAMSLTSGFAVC